MIPEMNKLAKHNEYLFLQDTAKLTLERQETTSITEAPSLVTK